MLSFDKQKVLGYKYPIFTPLSNSYGVIVGLHQLV